MLRFLIITFGASIHLNKYLGKKRTKREHQSNVTTAAENIYFIFHDMESARSSFHKSQYFSAQCQKQNIIISTSHGLVLISASSMSRVHAISLYIIITSFRPLSNNFLFHCSWSDKRFRFKHIIRRNTL